MPKKRKSIADDEPSNDNKAVESKEKDTAPPAEKKKKTSTQHETKAKEEQETKGEILVDESKHTSTIEKGHIYFFYRPKVSTKQVKGADDVQKILMILKPYWSSSNKRHPTLIIVGRKKLPQIKRHERYWAFVDKSTAKLEDVTEPLKEHGYETKTKGEQTIQAARPMGEGVYAIGTHQGHSHLAYMLTLPDQLTEVQDAFNLEKQGSIIISVKNPDQPSPAGTGLGDSQKANFPSALKKAFAGRRFVSMETTEFLNYENCELMLIGAKKDVMAELGKTGKALEEMEIEDEEHIEYVGVDQALFDDLHLESKNNPVEPLKGEWK
ncbi:hypothetical protein DFQ28_009273 [Apophysomyces sp. BC1034]|nr:hypothetical protein DFQ29_007987 [Apophysomyces sp. BC1021]KAG0185477.1 hypothetical protein DFQ28_009273 [Apophysomyces sp. BC1034]